MSVSENIKKIRKEKALTQKALGELCGINEANIRKYESGRANPKIETIRKFANALGVSMSDLIDDWSQFSPEELQNDWNISEANSKTSKMCNLFDSLNEAGQDKALEQVYLLTKVPEFRK